MTIEITYEMFRYDTSCNTCRQILF